MKTVVMGWYAVLVSYARLCFLQRHRRPQRQLSLSQDYLSVRKVYAYRHKGEIQ